MADGTVRVKEAAAGPGTKLIDNEELVVGANTVERQRAVAFGPNGALLATQATLASALAELSDIVAAVQGTLAVSGPLTDAQLRATAVAVSNPILSDVHDAGNQALQVNVVAGGVGGGAVTIADGADVAGGSTTDAAETSDSPGTRNGFLRGLVKWAYERMPSSLGQKLMAASLPVTLASDQTALAVDGPLTDAELRASAVAVSAATLPLPTGAATAANQQNDALTDTELRATPVPVSGTVSVTEPVSVDDNGSSLTVDNPVLDDVHDVANQALQVNVVASTGGGLTDAELRAAPVPVSGTVTASGPLTDAELRAAPVGVDGSGVTQPISAAALPLPAGAATAASQQTDALTDAELRATAVPVSAAALPLPAGAATAANQQTNGLTDAELRATPVAVSGTVAVTEPVSVDDNGASLTVDNPVLTDVHDVGNQALNVNVVASTGGGLTDAQLRATPVPVDGPLTDAELRASAVPVSGAVTTGTLNNGAQTAVEGTAVSVLASNGSRKSAVIQNVGAANMRVGITGVAATTGAQVKPGGRVLLGQPNVFTGAVFAIREGPDSTTAFAQEVT